MTDSKPYCFCFCESINNKICTKIGFWDGLSLQVQRGAFFVRVSPLFGTVFSLLLVVILLKMNATSALEHFGTVFSTY